jgi:hypothetical protein
MVPDRVNPGPASPQKQFSLFRLAAAAAAALAGAIMRLLAAKTGLAAAITALAILVLGDVRHGDLLGLGC